jgi:hypothetical protein
MQRAFAKLVGGVVVLDAVAISVFEWGHVQARGPAFVQRYVTGWTLASAAVAGWGLWQVKRARRGWRARHVPPRDPGSGTPRDD